MNKRKVKKISEYDLNRFNRINILVYLFIYLLNKNTIPWMLKKKAKKIKLNKIKFVFCISHSHNSPVLQLTEKLTKVEVVLYYLYE